MRACLADIDAAPTPAAGGSVATAYLEAIEVLRSDASWRDIAQRQNDRLLWTAAGTCLKLTGWTG